MTQNSTCDLSSAEVMEAEERELVIDDSVDDLRTYIGENLSDKQIEEQRLHLEDILPEPHEENK